MVHGILQFTPRIAFRYVLHRCESRDIRCRESYCLLGLGGAAECGVPGADRCSLATVRAVFRHPTRGAGAGGSGEEAPPEALRYVFAVVFRGDDNDPSAGSPTETLLRLLLPLNDKVQWTSRDVAGGEPPTSPRSEHFTGPFNR